MFPRQFHVLMIYGNMIRSQVDMTRFVPQAEIRTSLRTLDQQERPADQSVAARRLGTLIESENSPLD